MVPLDLRVATHGDLDRLAAIHQASARAAYGHIFPPAAAFPREAARAEIELHLTDPSMRTTIALRDGIATGLVVAGPADETIDGWPVEKIGQIRMLHVHPDAQRGGVGTRLLADALAWLGAAGYVRAVLWALVLSDQARRFYERRGWVADGARRTEQYAITVEIMRYARPL